MDATREEVRALVLYAVARHRLRRALRRITARSIVGLCTALAVAGADLGSARDPALLVVAMFVAHAWIAGVYAGRLHARSIMVARRGLTAATYRRVRSLDDFEALALAMALSGGLAAGQGGSRSTSGGHHEQ